MIDITFLGTSCMQPTKEKNHPGTLLRYESSYLLFDCGEGIQRQMRIAGLRPAKIKYLFISHWHGDHSFGIPGLLSAMGADGCKETLYIYGPKGSKEFMDHLRLAFSAKGVVSYVVHEVTSGKILSGPGFNVFAEELDHSIPCVGFRFVEEDKRKIDVKKTKKIGLAGPILSDIQQGREVVFEGKKIIPDAVSTVVPGKKVAYITDTRPCEGASKLAKDCELVVIEATHMNDLQEKSEQYKHMTVKEAVTLAALAHAKKIILTHVSQRYKDPQELLDEAKKSFSGEVIVAHDFMEVTL